MIAANYWGKFKTVSQMALIIVKIMDLGGIFVELEAVLTLIAVALTLISLMDYIMKNKEVLTKGGM